MADWTTLRHRPGRRHIGLLSLAGETRAILKLYDEADFEQATLGARFAAGIGGPALLAASPRHRILVSAWRKGRSLVDRLRQDQQGPAGVAAAGAAIAAVHGERRAGCRCARCAPRPRPWPKPSMPSRVWSPIRRPMPGTSPPGRPAAARDA
jgi:hypothetical protein